MTNLETTAEERLSHDVDATALADRGEKRIDIEVEFLIRLINDADKADRLTAEVERLKRENAAANAAREAAEERFTKEGRLNDHLSRQVGELTARLAVAEKALRGIAEHPVSSTSRQVQAIARAYFSSTALTPETKP